MDEHANQLLAYMAQIANAGIESTKGGLAKLVAFSDSDWAVSRSTTGFCITFGGEAGRSDSTASRSHLPKSRSSLPHTPLRRSSTFAVFSRKWGLSSATPRPSTSTTRAPLNCLWSSAPVSDRGMSIDAI
eukprot:6204293-Pleurochrysis_carterae.AAC.1